MPSPGQNIGNSLAGETIAIGIRSVAHLGAFFRGIQAVMAVRSRQRCMN